MQLENIPSISDDTVARGLGSQFIRILRQFPTTAIVFAPYLVLVLPVAIFNYNPQLWFIVGLLGVALGSCFVVELFVLIVFGKIPLRGVVIQEPVASTKPLWWLTVAVIVLSALATGFYTIGGGGTLLAQVSGAGSSTLTTVASLFSAWNIFGAGLLFASYLRRACSKRGLFIGLAFLISVEVAAAAATAITAPVVQFLTPVTLLALLLRVVRIRTVVALFLIVLVAWPLAFALRNDLRTSAGVWVSKDVSSSDRLRFDQQLAAAAQFDVPVNLGQPDLADIVRYGFIPRVLDSGRPPIASSSLINQALGGSATSSNNFLSIGTIYFFYGPVWLAIYYAAVAAAMSIVFRRSATDGGPIAMCMLALMIALPLGWSSTFPDALIGYLQALVSFLPILIGLGMIHWSTRTQQRRDLR